MINFEAQAVIVQGLFDPYRAIFLEFAAQAPLADHIGQLENDGRRGVISYSTKFAALYERVAVYIDKLLKGAKLPTFL